MKKYKDIRPPDGAATKNMYGQWVPAIEEPYYHLIRKECRCGRQFWTNEAYKGHYAYKHILGL